MSKLRSIILGLVAVSAFAAFASNASAATVTVTPGTFTASAANTLTLDPSGLGIACTFSLNGAISSPIVGATGTLLPVGTVSTGSSSGCLGGLFALTFLGLQNSSPRGPGWQITGRIDLPGPTIKLLITGQFNLNVIFGNCLYSGTIAATLNSAGNQLSFAAADNRLPLSSGSSACPNPGVLQGTMTVSPAQTINVAL
jgi:hypothetical protein